MRTRRQPYKLNEIGINAASSNVRDKIRCTFLNSWFVISLQNYRDLVFFVNWRQKCREAFGHMFATANEIRRTAWGIIMSQYETMFLRYHMQSSNGDVKSIVTSPDPYLPHTPLKWHHGPIQLWSSLPSARPCHSPCFDTFIVMHPIWLKSRTSKFSSSCPRFPCVCLSDGAVCVAMYYCIVITGKKHDVHMEQDHWKPLKKAGMRLHRVFSPNILTSL